MIVEGDERGGLEDGGLAKHFAGMDERAVEASGRDDLDLLQAVPGIENEHPELLERLGAEAREEESSGIARQSELGSGRRGRRGGALAELDGGEDAGDPRLLETSQSGETGGGAARESLEPAGPVEQVIGELQRGARSRARAEHDGEELVHPEVLRSPLEELLARPVGGREHPQRKRPQTWFSHPSFHRR